MLTARSHIAFATLCVTALLAACDASGPQVVSQKTARTAPAPKAAARVNAEIVSAEMSSREASPGETLAVRYEINTPTGAEPVLHFLWQWKHRTLPEQGPEVQVPIDARRGDTIKVRVTLKVGKHTSDAVWTSALVANSPVEWIDLRLEPADKVSPGNSLTAVPEAQDPDGDLIEYDYVWHLNGQQHINRGAHFSTTGLQRGDEVWVEATASDGEAWGSERVSNTVIVANSDPTIISAPPSLSGDGTLQYEVEARDHDGDRRFIYTLDAAPASMTIDRLTGMLKWSPTRSDIGQHSIEVRVDDRHGGYALQHFRLYVGGHFANAAPASPDSDRE